MRREEGRGSLRVDQTTVGRLLLAIVGAQLALASAGCEAVQFVLLDNRVSLTLVNNGDYPIEVDLRVSSEENQLEAILLEFGTNYLVTLPARDSVTIITAEDCDEVGSVIIDVASLDVLGDIGPELDTGVFRRGDHFDCGDEIVFTFDHSDLLIDFDVRFSTR
jgi:hypothetical protein